MLCNDYNFARFDKRTHLREGFDCGQPLLNDFLAKYASQQQEKHLTTVYVCYKATEEIPKLIYGYYSLSANSISASEFPESISKKLPLEQPIPTIKIGRLARDIKITSPGFGDKLLKDALYRAFRVSRNIGSMAIDVEAKNDRLVDFYTSYGFIRLRSSNTCLMLPTKTLEKAYKKSLLLEEAML